MLPNWNQSPNVAQKNFKFSFPNLVIFLKEKNKNIVTEYSLKKKKNWSFLARFLGPKK
jgi:hypothetical protein